MRPHLRLELNKNLDKRMAWAFLGISASGVDFGKGILRIHPKLKKLLHETSPSRSKAIINKYMDDFYAKHEVELGKEEQKLTGQWRAVENYFFMEIDKIFHKYPFPRGRYVGYVSALNCNPRFLSNKTFQVFNRHPQGGLYVICHELLHFIFYDYARKKFPKFFKGMDTEDGLFWDTAEIFNSIILHTEQFMKIHGVRRTVVYPQHKKYIRRLKKFWLNHQEINELIPEIYKIIR